MVSSVSHFQEATLSPTTMEEIIRRLTEVMAQQQLFTERLAARQEYTDQVVTQLQASAAARPPLLDAGVKAHQLLVRLMDQDDVEAYLHTFEGIATREGWVREEWARLIAPFLTGKAQRACYSLQSPRNEQYDDLKAEILARVGLSPTCAAQQFHQWTYDEKNSPPLPSLNHRLWISTLNCRDHRRLNWNTWSVSFRMCSVRPRAERQSYTMKSAHHLESSSGNGPTGYQRLAGRR